jgi:hypothetical protein
MMGGHIGFERYPRSKPTSSYLLQKGKVYSVQLLFSESIEAWTPLLCPTSKKGTGIT